MLKTTILFFLINLQMGLCIAQSVTFEYFEQILGFQTVSDVAQDEDGNYICLGSTRDSLSNKIEPYLFKLDQKGQKIAATTFKNELGDGAGSMKEILATPDGDFIIIGGAMPANRSDWQLWILKIDKQFNVFWSKTYGRKAWDEKADAGMINHQGEIIITSDSDSDPSIERYDFDPVFYRLSSEGDSLLARYYTYPDWQLVNDIIPNENNDGYYVFSDGLPDGTPFSRNHIAEYDSLFNLVDLQALPYQMYSNVSAKWALDFLFLYAGRRRNFRYIGHFGHGPIDVGLIVQDTSGAAFVAGDIGKEDTGELEALKGLDFHLLEAIYVGGTLQLDYHSFNPFYSDQKSYFMLGKYDYFDKEWEKYYGGDAYYILNKVLATQDGGALLAGTRYDASSSTGKDIYMLKVDAEGNILTSKDALELPSTEYLLYPNPVSTLLHIRMPNSSQAKVKLFDMNGQEIMQATFRQSYQLPMEHLPKGMYIYHLIDDAGRRAIGKLMKR